MRVRKVGLVMILGIVAVLVSMFPVTAAAIRTPYAGWAYLAGLVDPGTCSYPGAMEICRGLTVVFEFDVDDDRFDGLATTVINSNFHVAEPYYYGRQWGTLALVNDEGSWEGTWTGIKEQDGSTYLQGVGHGHGGYEGLHVHLSAMRLDPDMFEPLQVMGYILDPSDD